jgi:hypothetical protein
MNLTNGWRKTCENAAGIQEPNDKLLATAADRSAGPGVALVWAAMKWLEYWLG